MNKQSPHTPAATASLHGGLKVSEGQTAISSSKCFYQILLTAIWGDCSDLWTEQEEKPSARESITLTTVKSRLYALYGHDALRCGRQSWGRIVGPTCFLNIHGFEDSVFPSLHKNMFSHQPLNKGKLCIFLHTHLGYFSMAPMRCSK